MTKSQMLERIGQFAKVSKDSMKIATKAVLDAHDKDSAALALALIAGGSSITDALNNVAIILCETLPEEE